jgi:CheY-like chemotaxis protein
LGTATVYGIVKQNRGVIDVESTVGLGTSMLVYLPTAQGDDAKAETVAVPLAEGTETVLVVEDEAAMLATCTRMLTRLGYTVIGCASPADALAAVQAHQGPVHVVLTDVVMPGMNGRQLADALVQNNPAIRVLFMSGYTGEMMAQHGVFADNVYLLSKPFSIAELAVKMREVCG